MYSWKAMIFAFGKSPSTEGLPSARFGECEVTRTLTTYRTRVYILWSTPMPRRQLSITILSFNSAWKAWVTPMCPTCAASMTCMLLESLSRHDNLLRPLPTIFYPPRCLPNSPQLFPQDNPLSSLLCSHLALQVANQAKDQPSQW